MDFLRRLPVGAPVEGPVGGWLTASETWQTPAPPSPIYAESRAGGPLFGPPWTTTFQVAPPGQVPRPSSPGTAGGTAVEAKPFIPRVPKSTDTRRLAHTTEQLSAIINSLIGQGLLTQVGPAQWELGIGGSIGGLTGTFPGDTVPASSVVPVPNGTYIVGFGINTDGEITVQEGIITGITQAT